MTPQQAVPVDLKHIFCPRLVQKHVRMLKVLTTLPVQRLLPSDCAQSVVMILVQQIRSAHRDASAQTILRRPLLSAHAP